MWIALAISIILSVIGIYCITHTHQINTQIDIKNAELRELNSSLKNTNNDLATILSNKKIEISAAEEKLTRIKDEQIDLIKSSQAFYDTQKETSQKAFENYCQILENQYKEKEEEYDQFTDALETAYSNLQLKLMQESDEVRADLDKIKASRTAAIEAQLREKEIENNLSFYCIEISDSDKADIARLEALKPSLNKPRVLSMLIWQTWFQKPLKALAANVVGVEDKMGIYKITNIKTKECYVGQAVSIKDRWNEHVKCGLGIDTPANNKLYKSMQEFGLWNFSFEILEECPREQLNEKERYYIDLYQSYDFGYNSNKGVKK